MIYICGICTKLCAVKPPINDKKVEVVACGDCSLKMLVAQISQSEPEEPEGGDDESN